MPQFQNYIASIMKTKKFDPNVFHIIGMSPGNSYFKDDEVRYLLKTVVERFGHVGVLIADIPAISTYIALGYSANRARRDKAIPRGNALKNRVRKTMAELGYTTDHVKVFDWHNEVESNLGYLKHYGNIKDLYNRSKAFSNAADNTTRAVLKGSQRKITNPEKATAIAVHYLLSEIAFLEFLPSYLGTERIVYVYHKNWQIYEDYISGKFDKTIKQHLDFLLIENPYETYNPIWGLEDEEDNTYRDVLDRIAKTKLLRVGFTNYVPALMYDRDYDNFAGIFYEIIIVIAKKHGWRVRWTEEIGYGVIIDGLNSERFDLFGSPVWPTPERKPKAYFSSLPYKSPAFTWIRSDYGKKENEIRNDPSIRVAVKENDISDSIANADFPRNRKVYVPQLADTIELLKFVAENRADFTFVEPFTAQHFNKISRAPVILASEKPIRIYENTFIMKRGEQRLRKLLDAELALLHKQGVIRELVKKYTGSDDTYIFG
ncbi:tRNA-dependent cyclodipeptide synthase [Candidatus Uhrbacteria bacterium]|nr:tRNA-dependent cyclodipeptide synthase [Candidatus Uhrbacteria bacterium]